MPTITGVIRRRVLVNFAAEPGVVARLLPAPLVPRIVEGRAVVGVCLIRLEEIRPRGLPAALGLSSENAAHRIAVTLPDGRDAVFVPRRDTDSRINELAGGRLFPGEHHRADFTVTDAGGTIDLAMRARDGGASVSLRASATEHLDSRLFGSLAEASEFFRRGSLGYSARSTPGCLDGITLHTDAWAVAPLSVERLASSFFEDETRFPRGTLTPDCALVIRDIPHEWRAEPVLATTGP